jgi:hypothetical protein
MTQTSIGIQEVGVPGMHHDMAEWMIVGEVSDMVSHDDLFLQFNHVSSGSESTLIHVGQKWGWLRKQKRRTVCVVERSVGTIRISASRDRLLHPRLRSHFDYNHLLLPLQTSVRPLLRS